MNKSKWYWAVVIVCVLLPPVGWVIIALMWNYEFDEAAKAKAEDDNEEDVIWVTTPEDDAQNGANE